MNSYAGNRILVLIPHPDDEVVGCCAAIGRAIAAGSSVFGLYLTTGVPAADILWPWHRAGHPACVKTRRAEAEKVAELIGLEPVGFSDIPSRRLRHHLPETTAAINGIIAEYGIDVLWAPAYEGGHQDHDSANALANAFRERIRVFEFAEYNFLGGRVRSQHFPQETGAEDVLDLSADEVTKKKQCLAIYRSEKANLFFVESQRECLRPLVDYAYDRPIHAGRLFYERFHWVPFRHPRIDFTPSGEVCKILSAYVETGKTSEQE